MMLNDNVAAAFRALEATLRASAATHTPNARAILRAQIASPMYVQMLIYATNY